MGANVVEEVPDFIKCVLQSGWAVNVDLPDERLDTTKEAFYATIAPRSTNWDALVTNADQLQERLEHSAFEDQFVVSADGSGFAILADSQAQVANQRPAALVDHRRQPRAVARPVIDDAQHGAWCPVVVPHKRQVHAPDAVDVHRRGALVAQFAGNVEQRVLVVADGVADKGLADSCWRMQAVEGVSHFATTDMFAHQGFEAQHFVHNPVGLLAGQWRWGVNGSWSHNGASREPLASFPVVSSGQMGQGEERWCHDQNRDQHEEPNEHGQKVPDYEGEAVCQLKSMMRRLQKVVH